MIVGELSREESRGVSATLHQWGYPVITEALSQLAEDPAIEELVDQFEEPRCEGTYYHRAKEHCDVGADDEK